MARGVTSVGVGLDAVAVLQPVAPGAIVPGRRVQALAGAVATLEAARPLSPVQPLALGLHAESVAFPLRPVASVHVAAGPGVHADRLEAAAPRARIFALALGSGAHALAVSFAVLPASAVGAPIVEVEAAARHSETEFQMERVLPLLTSARAFFKDQRRLVADEANSQRGKRRRDIGGNGTWHCDGRRGDGERHCAVERQDPMVPPLGCYRRERDNLRRVTARRFRCGFSKLNRRFTRAALFAIRSREIIPFGAL